MKNKFIIIIPLVALFVVFIVLFLVFITVVIPPRTQVVTKMPTTSTAFGTSLPLNVPATNTTEPSPQAVFGWQPLEPIPVTYRYLRTNGDRTSNKVALTFDLCQTEENPSGFDTALVNVLIETQTPATFFLGGLWMQDHLEEAKKLASVPFFELGNHSWSHLDFENIPPEVMSEEIIKTQSLMWDVVGYQTNIFRFPYGTYSEEAIDVVGEYGLYAIQWDVESGDPDPNVTADAMIPWVLQQTQSGSIIIMHANGRGWNTAEALPEIIRTLRANGYEFVTISELLDIESP